MSEAAVSLEGVRRTFGDVAAVDGIDLSVRPGELLTLLGPSGCGKTTTLNMIAGFLPPDAGTIRLAGRPVQDLPPYRRDIGLVFQDYALFPHMSVQENVAFGLQMRRLPKAEIATRVADVLDLVRLRGLAGRRPTELSGGQRQRVALARALVIRPTVLLLDEPLSNLDLKLREEMRIEITTVQRRIGITTMLVTHDQGEALVASDTVAVLNHGRIEQIGPPSTIYEEPETRFVAEFIGQMNFLPGRARADSAAGRCAIEVAGVVVTARAPRPIRAGEAVDLAFRPERVAAGREAVPSSLTLAGGVARTFYLGTRRETHVALEGGGTVVVELVNDGRHDPLPVDAGVHLSVAERDCSAFPRP